MIGPAGLLASRARRDPLLGDPAQRGFDTSLLVLLLLTSTTGLVLLVLRNGAAMRPLLFLHLGAVLAFFVTIPYSKFVHGFYRDAGAGAVAARVAARGVLVRRGTQRSEDADPHPTPP